MKQKINYFLIATLTGIITAGSLSFGLFAGWENFLEDRLFSTKPVNKDIIIISIDNESLTHLGQWPWPRKIFAQAINKLNQEQVKAVALDIVFSEPSRLGTEDDASLATAISNKKFPLVLAGEGENLNLNNNIPTADKFIAPLSEFASTTNTYTGQVNLIAERDGVVRNFPLFINWQNQTINSLAYELALNSGQNLLNLNNLSAINRLAYSAKPGNIRQIPFWRLLEKESLNLNNKIVLVGATASDLHDDQITPLSGGQKMSGVEIQANILNMILSNYSLKPLSLPIMAIILLIVSLLSVLPFVFSRSIIKAITANIIFIILQIIISIIFFQAGLIINIIHLCLAWVLSVGALFLYRYLIIEKEKRQVKNIFAKYVSPEVMAEILKKPDQVILGGQEKEMTILFSDIRSFTTMSEGLTPQELVRVLNKYFTAMTGEVLRHHGVIDKYIGDAIMAFWGAPIDDTSHADNALKAAMAMIKSLEKLNQELKANNDPEIHIGVGIYTGPVVVGNIGSDLRMDYTVIGDTVNTASRLEGLNKEYKTQIIIGESTKNQIKDNYEFIPLGGVKVKGKNQEVKIYTVK
ncbi:MAG: adenylate/guanylate cyclase domain-containing protein [bacterium]